MTEAELEQHWPGVSFTPTEARLLGFLHGCGGRPATEAELLREVWGYAPTTKTRTVSTTIRRLRKKIEADPKRPRQLLFLRGRGYALVHPETRAVTRSEVERRLREWLGPDQEWVTLIAHEAGRRGRIPSPSTRLIGREHVMEQLRARIRGGDRVLTVHGAAGLGKTTLALELARTFRDLPGGAWFCPVEHATDVDALLAAIGGCIGISRPPDASRSLADQLVQVLRHLGPTLLVLDNFEQLPTEAAKTVADLVRQAPELQVVVTSRRVLNIRAETTYPLAPLDLAEGVELLTRCLEQAGQEVDDDSALKTIVELVEGVPLAIEMAAARARLFSLTELRARLSQDLRVLAHGPGPRPDRQQTLDQAIAWSWGLLPESERGALTALTVFRGGFSIEAAERVLDDADGLERLASLVDHAMIRRTPGARFALFESVRQFVARRSPCPSAVRARHADWAVQLVERRRQSDRQEWERACSVELENVLAAVAFLRERGDARAVTLVDGLSRMKRRRYLRDDLSDQIRRTRAAMPSDPELGPRLNVALARTLCGERSFDEAQVEVERGLERARPGSAVQIALLATAAFIARQRGDERAAMALAQRATPEALRSGEVGIALQATMIIGASQMDLGQIEEAEQTFDRALELARSDRAPDLEALALANRAACLMVARRTDEAIPQLLKAEELAIKADSPGVLFSIRTNLATCYTFAGRYAEAAPVFTMLIQQHAIYGAHIVGGSLQLNAGLNALFLGDSERATELLALAYAEFSHRGNRSTRSRMAAAYLGVAWVEVGDLGAADQAWEGIEPPDGSGPWPHAVEEFELCMSTRHLGLWRRDGDEAHLHALREALERFGTPCVATAAYRVLTRALERATPPGDQRASSPRSR